MMYDQTRDEPGDDIFQPTLIESGQAKCRCLIVFGHSPASLCNSHVKVGHNRQLVGVKNGNKYSGRYSY